MTTTPAMPEPFAWAWRNKVTGAKGVYFEDPKPFGITSHPDYEWTNLYTEAQPIATLQAQPAEVSDAELRKTIDALRDPGTVSAFYNGYYTLTPDELRRAILALRPQSYPLPDDLYDSKDWRQGDYASRVEWLHTMYEHAKHERDEYAAQLEALRPQAVPMTDEQAVLEDEEFSLLSQTQVAALLWVLWCHQGASSPVGQPIRFALGMGKRQAMSDEQVSAAQRFRIDWHQWSGITAPAGGEG